MMYSIGLFILDNEKEQIFLEASKEIVSGHARTAQLLCILADAYPKAVSKKELTKKLWRDGEVTDWALSTTIYQLRQLLSAHDPDIQYIKTVHTQGFKLDIEPKIIAPTTSAELISEQSIRTAETDSQAKKSQRRLSNWLLVCAILFLAALSTFVYHWAKSPLPNYGEILPKKTISLPVNANWVSSKPNTLAFTADGILIAPIDAEPVYVSTGVTSSGFYQGAVFSIGLKLTQEFVDNKGGLRFYYQSTQDGWPGEWDCILDDIKTLNFIYQCQIDENGIFTKILENETVNFGVKLHQLNSVGKAIITSAEVKLPASISTDKGWHTTNHLPLEYDRGVAFQPKSLAAKLATTIKGPKNIQESTFAFTLEVDDSYKNPDRGIVFFLVGKNGEWHDCFLNGEDIQSNVFTKTCNFKNNKSPFLLKENEQIEVGLAPYGKSIHGKIKILGITLIE